MAKKSLKRYIVEKLGKLNECGGSYYSGPSCSGTSSSSSSSSGSCGFGGGGGSSSTPSRRRTSGGGEIKELTSQIYGSSKVMAGYIDKMTRLSRQQRKTMPTQLKNVLQKLKAASEEYVRLIDYYTESI